MKILIVDDKPENLYLLELILKGSGYISVSAKNGVEALELARKEIPALIITDILMPVMDGFTLCREIKKDERLCNVPLIFYTATYTDPKDEEFALSLGADRFILKPTEPEVFISLVEEVLKEAKNKNIQTMKVSSISDQLVLKEYSEALIRKLEDKMLQAEQAEREARKYNIALLREIEERKQAEELLRKSERQISLIYDTVGDIIFNLKVENDGGYIFTSVNQCFLKTTGLRFNQIIGKRVQDIIPEPSLTFALEKYVEAIRGKKIVRWEETSEYPFGKLIGEVSVAPVFDDSMNCISLVGSVHDITERKKSEKELAASEIKYRAFFENSLDAILLTSPDGKIFSANPAACILFGYSEEEFCNLDRSDVVDITDTRLLVLLSERESTGKAHGELTMIRKNGTHFPAEISSSIFKNQEGLKRTSMIIRDISQRKLAEKALLESEERFKILFEASPDALMLLDPSINPGWSIVECNEMACRMNGYTREELIGRSIDMLHVSAGTAQERLEFLTKIRKEGVVKAENFHRHKDGHIFPIEFSTTIATVHGWELILGIDRDITARKRAEEEITMLAHSLRSINECVSITDLDDNIIFVNESFLKTYGYEYDELIGQNIIVVRSPNNLSEQVQQISPATLSGGWSGELLNKKKNGSEFPIYLSTTAINNKEGKILGLIGVAIDITDRKRAEKELIEAKEKAERSDKLKTEFLAQMSHEIRTPLNVINGNVGYLSELFEENKDEDIKNCFDGITFASGRIIRTIELILNYAELQTQGYKPNFVEINIDDEILNPLVSEYKLVAEKKGLSVFYTNHADDPKIIVDDYSIRQIFGNLIDNAVKYTQNGNIEIILDNDETGSLFVQIKDTGIGMSPEFLSNIYTPFFQEEQGYSRSFDGNGLGLSLVQKYCKMNNAVIVVESKKNIGTVFTVTFKK